MNNVLIETAQKNARLARPPDRLGLAWRPDEAVEKARDDELLAWLASACHQLRSPLWALRGLMDLLTEQGAGAPDAEARRHLQRILLCEQRATETVDAVAELVKVCRHPLNLTCVDVSRLAAAAAAEAARANPQRAVDFVGTTGVYAYGDEELLNTALRHLMANAWKFTRRTAAARVKFGAVDLEQRALPGGAVPATSGHGTPNAGPGARLWVCFLQDNGVGFDEALAEKLFGPFQRLHPASEFEGRGVGLALARRIIRRHNGQLWGHGAVGKGATFCFTLPLAGRAAADHAMPNAASAAAGREGGTPCP